MGSEAAIRVLREGAGRALGVAQDRLEGVLIRGRLPMADALGAHWQVAV